MTRSAVFDYALRLGDDALILGQRLSEWCGHSPMLEIDLALSNIALDLLGHATLFLGLAAELEDKGRDADELAFRRDVLDFRNCLLVEQPNGDFAQTMARQFLFSNWQRILLRELSRSNHDGLAPIAAKAVKEVAYHATFASEWIVRLGDGTADSRTRVVAGLEWMWRFADELFISDPTTDLLTQQGVAVDMRSHRGEWDSVIQSVLMKATLDVPKARRAAYGGRRGHHSEHLGHLLSEMQFLPRAYPGAKW